MKKLRIGIIGLGIVGKAHCQSCSEIPEIELSGVFDVNKKLADEITGKYKSKSYQGYEEMINSGNIDAVIVATPHYLHPVIGIYAMERGLHLLSEKPIAVTIGKADEMIKTAKKTKRIFSVLYQRRSNPVFLAAKKLIDEGKLGKIFRTSMSYPDFRPQAYYDSAKWRATWKGEGGGILINQASHYLDVFCWLGGMPGTVYSKVRTRRHRIEVEDEAFALLDYPNGASGYFYTSMNDSYFAPRFEIFGEKGYILFDEKNLQFFKLEKSLQKTSDTLKEMFGWPESSQVKVKLPDVEFSHKTIIRNFARAILYGEKLLSPGAEGRNPVELANAFVISGKTGKEVTLPLDPGKVESFYNRLRNNPCCHFRR